MSDFDPANPVIPTGDTIKIAIVASFSGPAALVGQIYWASGLWAVHDINKRGGIMVDGKKKLVELIKADHVSKPDQAKKITERMVLQDKVNVLWGTDGSNLQKIINETANKYKVIAINTASLSDDLQDATNFSRYAFQIEHVRRPVRPRPGLLLRPDQEEGEEVLHPLPGLLVRPRAGRGLQEGIEGVLPRGADRRRGLPQALPDRLRPLPGEDQGLRRRCGLHRRLDPGRGQPAEAGHGRAGIALPFAHVFMDEPNFLHEVGVEGTKGLVQISQYGTENPAFKTPEQIKYYKTWNDLWNNKWKTAPFNSPLFEHGTGNIGSYIEQTYWLLSVIARAQSTDPEKIIKVWEGDSYRFTNGKVIKMRACDHKAIQDLHIVEFVPPGEQKQSFNIRPYYW